MAGPKTAAETEQEEGKSKLDISSDGGAPGSGKPPSSMQYSGKVQQKALTLIQGTLVQSDPAAPGIGANASAGEIATWIEDDGGLKGALRILPAALEEMKGDAEALEVNEQAAAHLTKRFKHLAQADPTILAPRITTALSIWAACSEELETQAELMASQLGGALAAGRLLANSTPDEHVPQDNAKKGEKHSFELLYYRADIDLMGDAGLTIGTVFGLANSLCGSDGDGPRRRGEGGEGGAATRQRDACCVTGRQRVRPGRDERWNQSR